MHTGATLGRRFTVLRSTPYDLPGIDRWVARDERRSVDVVLDVLTSRAPGAVRQAAVRAAQVRDQRFARVLASGRESVAGERVTYVVTEASGGVSLAAIAGQRIMPPGVAAAIVGEVARALGAAADQDVHHGYLRADAIHIVHPGRVMISGLAVDGETATQAGLGRGTSEAADAYALARLHLTLVTGMDPDHVTVADIPEELGARTADMARSVVAGEGPTSLGALAATMGPADSRALRDVPRALALWPRTPGAQLPAGVTHDDDPTRVVVDPETVALAQRLASSAVAPAHVAPEIATAVDAGKLEEILLPAVPASQSPGHIPVTEEEAAKYSARTRRLAARSAHEDLGLDTWDVIATDQNRSAPPSFVQAVLEWLQRKRPDSPSLGAAADQARHRAYRPAPLHSGPVLVSIFLAVTIIAAIVSIEMLRAPFESGPLDIPAPAHPYPEFTFSPEPVPESSPDASPDASPDPSTSPSGDE